MKFCSNCGGKIDVETAKFCSNCGFNFQVKMEVSEAPATEENDEQKKCNLNCG